MLIKTCVVKSLENRVQIRKYSIKELQAKQPLGYKQDVGTKKKHTLVKNISDKETGDICA